MNWRMGRASFILDFIEPDLRLFVMGKVNPNSADDVLQEPFKGILRQLEDFRGNTSREFWGFCYKIARNKVADHYDAENRVQRFQTDEMAKLIRLSTRTETLTAEDRADLKYALDLLEKSKPVCRDLLWKRFVIGFTHKELGEEFGLKPDAVRIKADRCIKEIRKLLGE